MKKRRLVLSSVAVLVALAVMAPATVGALWWARDVHNRYGEEDGYEWGAQNCLLTNSSDYDELVAIQVDWETHGDEDLEEGEYELYIRGQIDHNDDEKYDKTKRAERQLIFLRSYSVYWNPDTDSTDDTFTGKGRHRLYDDNGTLIVNKTTTTEIEVSGAPFVSCED